MKTRKPFSEELRAAIDASGMSRYAICKAIGLDQAEMSRFMARKYGLRMQVLDKLAELLDLHLRKGE
jgi:transcriptional regulator with XRE-family HTH domain